MCVCMHAYVCVCLCVCVCVRVCVCVCFHASPCYSLAALLRSLKLECQEFMQKAFSEARKEGAAGTEPTSAPAAGSGVTAPGSGS
jgi:hypothetical protein